MSALRLALATLLLGAAPAEVPMGKFAQWNSYQRVPLDFSSGYITVHVEALPCLKEPTTEGCRWEHRNNQGGVTIIAPHTTPVIIQTDRQSEYARIAVVQFDKRDTRPGVIIESQYGGSGGLLTVQLVVPVQGGYRVLPLERVHGGSLEGQIADFPKDLSGDGRIDLELTDGSFDSAFGCNACTPRPPMLFTVRNGAVVDESSDPALRPVFAADMARLAPGCLSQRPGRNGICAAYVAAAARAGQFDAAWAAILTHYEHGADVWQYCDAPVSTWVAHRCPAEHSTHYADFPQSLRAFLVRTRYLPG